MKSMTRSFLVGVAAVSVLALMAFAEWKERSLRALADQQRGAILAEVAKIQEEQVLAREQRDRIERALERLTAARALGR